MASGHSEALTEAPTEALIGAPTEALTGALTGHSEALTEALCAPTASELQALMVYLYPQMRSRMYSNAVLPMFQTCSREMHPVQLHFVV